MFKAHSASVRCVDFSTDGKSLLTSSDDKTVKVNIHMIHTYVHYHDQPCYHHVYVHMYTICVQIFSGLNFHKFCKSTGFCENKNAEICTHMVQVCSCKLPFAKLNCKIC